MSYTPNTWKSGDVVTSAKLNNMEQGIANAGGMIVHDNNGTLDKTWQEIYDAAPFVTIIMDESGNLTFMSLFGIGENEGTFMMLCGFIDPGGYTGRVYFATSASGYPVLSE